MCIFNCSDLGVGFLFSSVAYEEHIPMNSTNLGGFADLVT